ncbi:JmjC domain-containing protein [Streptomyces sp. CBMA29]|uniref:JmjC domain-containing protein n=1 Tax=Streptomyces sp. CBMA29 TaxID=1896314 RepID=UPI001661E40C|nr:cupin domain-containing protein [Streptomyces sp. CBMA29]MBD0734042.1 hypothetical protein [Streptomyces sp. CBMA29]
MSAISELTGHGGTFADGWPATPQVYTASMDLSSLFSPEAARTVLTDPQYRPKSMGMVRDGALTGEPSDAEHDKSTLGLNGMHVAWPPIAEFASRLSVELGHPMTGNVYRTPPNSRGYGPHWDTHHVFLAQVTGLKHWHLFEPVFPTPGEEHNWVSVGITDEQRKHFLNDSPDISVGLRAGQVLYIPRGWIHFGDTSDEQSLHVTLGAHLTDRSWLLGQLLDAARVDPSIRVELPPLLGESDFEDHVGDAASAFLEWLGTPAGAEAVRSLAQRSSDRARTTQ